MCTVVACDTKSHSYTRYTCILSYSRLLTTGCLFVSSCSALFHIFNITCGKRGKIWMIKFSDVKMMSHGHDLNFLVTSHLLSTVHARDRLCVCPKLVYKISKEHTPCTNRAFVNGVCSSDILYTQRS